MKSCAILVREEIIFSFKHINGIYSFYLKIETKIPTHFLIKDEHSPLHQILMHYASSLEKKFQLCPSCLLNLNLIHVIFWNKNSLVIYI
jgi:hypothetical protein